MKKQFLLCVFWFCLLIAVPIFGAQAFDATTFTKKCSSCHTIGGGNDVGPDLKDVTKRREKAWMRKFIASPQAVISAGDPVANELLNKFKLKVMPDQEMSDAEFEQLYAFLETGGAGLAAPVTYRKVSEASSYDIQKGAALFNGHLRFQNGGPACFSCHSAGAAGILGGGAFGPNLTRASVTYGDNGLSKVITLIAFPNMTEVFKDKTLTSEEVFAVKSYLFDVDRNTPVVDNSNLKKFFFLGLVGTVMTLVLLDFAFKFRRRKTKRPIY
ncbi:MAG: cytochrome c [Bdellovibrio sp.]|nr:cytochrome c [Bdellovibrio sp.]